ncbi:PREDICTED: uncharacterized protein LOC106742517 [Dinoponera quadriceps]|uniref:Uncharacterized protein LOC106742517 n=1 Tax=Dinoponera quadriceps TaxID=609295 RepID=A0A6P3WY09_DINQU|nr:PREDICTED: uncharacterized protein LOC106742517 [Dinoponera quadriceps]
MAREEETTIFRRFQVFMEDEMGAGKLITYGIASAGLLVAMYRIRPFTRFKKPSDVPSHFLQSRVPLQGTVMRVEPSGGVLLMVDHQPLLPLPWFNQTSQLPVKIGGVDVTGNGVSWLQTVVNRKLVTFVPIVKKRDYLECTVVMPQKDQDPLKIGEELVKLGLATVHESGTRLKDKHVSAYRRSLANAQKWAARRRNGHWHFSRQPTVVWKMQMFVIDKLKSSLPAYIVRQLDL